MRSSYKSGDVTMLLKDITGLVNPQPTEERERLIQSGRHYSEMLPVEYVPTQRYMEVYQEALSQWEGCLTGLCRQGEKRWCWCPLQGRAFRWGF